MQAHKQFYIRPIGNINSYEEYLMNVSNGKLELNIFSVISRFEYNKNGDLSSEIRINPKTKVIESETKFEYKDHLKSKEIQITKHGESISSYFYRDSKLAKIEFRNSNGSKFDYVYKYDSQGRLKTKSGIFKEHTSKSTFEYKSIDNELIKTEKVNNELKSVEHFVNNQLIKEYIYAGDELHEYHYSKQGLLMLIKEPDYIRKYSYNKNNYVTEYHGYDNTEDYTKEYYYYNFDHMNNWISIDCYEERFDFPKHHRTRKIRKINYT
jgi:hypothetical protein